MKKRLVRWMFATGALLAAGNGVVFLHAWRFTHFVPAGERTAAPDRLGWLERVEVLLTGVRVPRPALRASLADFGLVGEEVHVGPIAAWDVPAGEGDASGAADVSGCRYAPLGACPDDTAILFHGYAGTRSDLAGDAAFFHARGLRAVLVDFPGSGGSDGDVTTLGWREAEVVRDLAARFRPHTGRLVLFGKSMGAAAVLRAVGVFGVTADRLVLENPFDRLVTTVGHRFEQFGLPPTPFAQLLVFWGGVQLGFDGLAHDPVAYARDVRVPTLLMVGEEDPSARPEEVGHVRDALGGPAYPLVVFPGAGHVGLRAADAARWEEAVGTALLPIVGDPGPGVAPPRPLEAASPWASEACFDVAELVARRAGIPSDALARRWGEVGDPGVEGQWGALAVRTRVLASARTPDAEVLLVACELAGKGADRDVGSAQHVVAVRDGALLWSERVGLQECCGTEWWSKAKLAWVPDFPPGRGAVRLTGAIDGRGDQEGYEGRAARWIVPAVSVGRVGCEAERGLPTGLFALVDGTVLADATPWRVRSTVTTRDAAMTIEERWRPEGGGAAETWSRAFEAEEGTIRERCRRSRPE